MSVGLSHDTEQVLDLLRHLHHVRITVINDHQELYDYAAQLRLHPVQHMFSGDYLRQLFQQLKEKQVILMTDALQIRTALFFLEEQPVILGPFTSVILTAQDIRALLHRYPAPHLTESELLRYTDAFPCIPEPEVMHMITSLFHVLFPSESGHEFIRIDYRETAEQKTEEEMAAKREDHTRLLERRYSYEHSFILAIMAGNARKALQEMRNMQIDVAYLKRIGTTMENERVGSAIVRTTARLAARQAGLPALLLDRIASDNTISVIRARNVEEIANAQELMVRAYCKAVQTLRQEKYCALVQSAIYYMEREYAGEISMQSLAAELDVSVNHLIRVFKKETQVTPNIYLRRFRLRQAERLLAATDLSVQDIASFIGIPDANYMIKLFKAEYGTTPVVYRKMYRV